jgi:hypothetical protein
MKISITRAMLIASQAVGRAYDETKPALTEDEQRGAGAMFQTAHDYVMAAFASATPWKVVRRTISGSQRWHIQDRVSGKYWCRRGSDVPVRYKHQTTAQEMCDRLNMSRLRNA